MYVGTYKFIVPIIGPFPPYRENQNKNLTFKVFVLNTFILTVLPGKLRLFQILGFPIRIYAIDLLILKNYTRDLTWVEF